MESNSSASACVPCVWTFPRLQAALLLSLSALAVLPAGCALWRAFSAPINDRTDLLGLGLLCNDFLLNVSVLVCMSLILSLHQSSQYAWTVLFSIMGLGRPLLQCLISVERCVAVSRPVLYLRSRPLRYRAAILAAVALVVCAVCCAVTLLCAAGQGNPLVYQYINCIFWLLNVLVVSFCCATMLRVVARPPPGDGRSGRVGAKCQGSGDNLSRRIQRNLFIVVSLIEVYSLTCYLPPIVLFLIRLDLCAQRIFMLWFSLLANSCYHFYRVNNGFQLIKK